MSYKWRKVVWIGEEDLCIFPSAGERNEEDYGMQRNEPSTITAYTQQAFLITKEAYNVLPKMRNAKR